MSLVEEYIRSGEDAMVDRDLNLSTKAGQVQDLR